MVFLSISNTKKNGMENYPEALLMRFMLSTLSMQYVICVEIIMNIGRCLSIFPGLLPCRSI